MKVTIFLTKDCNLECNYCYEGKKYKNYMTIETAEKVIEFINNQIKKIAPYSKRGNLVKIVLYGGEPLINHEVVKHILDKLEKEVDYKTEVDITINGTILDSDTLKTLQRIDSVSVSIDGGEEVHNLNRVFKNKNGTFQIVRENIIKLISSGINVRARGTYNSQTCRKLYESVREISKLGVDCIVMHPDIYDKNWENQDFDIIFSEIKKISNDQDLSKTCEHISLIDIDDIANKRGSCFGGIADFAIDYDGSIYPCTMAAGKEEFLIGNVYNQYLNKEKIEQLFGLNIDNEICIGCSRIENCDGNRCKIINKIDTGNFFVPNGIICKLQSLEVKKYKYIKELEYRNDFFE